MRNYLKSFNVLSDEEIGTLEKMVRRKTLKKGEFFIQAGNTCNEIAFIASGILRSFYYSSNSEEITFCLTFQNSFMTAYSSLISNTKTNENIEALSDVELYVFTRDQLLQLENSSMNWLKFSKMMAEQEYIRLEQRIFLLQKESAETRYEDLVKNHPEYLKSIPLTYLASYLGVTQRHLSRLRKLKTAQTNVLSHNELNVFLCRKKEMKNILIINGHPDKQSFNYALSEAYKNGTKTTTAVVEEINIADLNFDPNLKFGFRERMELEPDLLEVIDKIKRADHIVWFFPIWWQGSPALMKGFIDRAFLPGITFEMIKGKPLPKKLLKGKTARLVVTSDTPRWYNYLILKNPAINQIKKGTLQFCGIRPTKITYISPLKDSTAEFRENWVKKVFQLGEKLS